jgi:hypothetical protein
MGGVRQFVAQQRQTSPGAGLISPGAEKDGIPHAEGFGLVAAGQGVCGRAGKKTHPRQFHLQEAAEHGLKRRIQGKKTAVFQHPGQQALIFRFLRFPG